MEAATASTESASILTDATLIGVKGPRDGGLSGAQRV